MKKKKRENKRNVPSLSDTVIDCGKIIQYPYTNAIILLYTSGVRIVMCCHRYWTPPINSRASGAAPFSSAFEKSKPGFSS
jgi:hypothetical protein